LTGSHEATGWARWLSIIVTFTVVVIAWVPFRSANLETTQAMLMGMAGMNGVSLPVSLEVRLAPWLGPFVIFEGFQPGGSLRDAIMWLSMGFPVIWFLPNTQQWLSRYAPAWEAVTSHSRLAWQPTRRYALLIGTMFVVSLLSLNRVSEFLYFQF
jgi:alginate O-acetyltransferase complex protein AlgI